MEKIISSVTDVRVDTESEPGQVTMNVGHGDYSGPAWLEPAQARELAAALLRAADEAEWSAGVNTYPEVAAGDLRIGDVLRPSVDYRGDDNDQTAVCTAVLKRIDAPYLRVTWRTQGSSETWTSTMHAKESVCLMRRGPEEPPRVP